GFKEYKKQFDLSTLGFTNRTADSVNKNNEKMLSMRQLQKAIDSLQKENRRIKDQMTKDMLLQFHFSSRPDSFWLQPALNLPEK
ncbi:MAG TPA: hypothetical protein PK977_10050, partial [Chitinophagaceae bacterium]|nr:hypothetical protein [Chitinophagaceae bacterium]